MNRQKIIRWGFFFAGITIMSLGISLTIKGQSLGISPWDVLHIGLYRQLGLSIGSWNIITGLAIISFVSMVTKEWPKLGTWLNIIVIGIFIDIFNWLLPDITTFWGQTIVFVVGAIVMGCGSAIYVSPALGAGPRDSLMLLLVDKFGFSIRGIRTVIEILVSILGWFLGGPIGVGTVIIALLLGPIIHYALPQSQKLLLKCMRVKDISVLK